MIVGAMADDALLDVAPARGCDVLDPTLVVPTDIVGELQLADYVQEIVERFKADFPDLIFHSGRRDLAQQAQAMAANVVCNRRWIAETYAATPERNALQSWADSHPEANQETLAAGFLEIMTPWEDEQKAHLSRHFSGEAVDIQPVPGERGKEIQEAIARLPNLRKFLTREGGLTIWHAEFERAV